MIIGSEKCELDKPYGQRLKRDSFGTTGDWYGGVSLYISRRSIACAVMASIHAEVVSQPPGFIMGPNARPHSTKCQVVPDMMRISLLVPYMLLDMPPSLVGN